MIPLKGLVLIVFQLWFYRIVSLRYILAGLLDICLKEFRCPGDRNVPVLENAWESFLLKSDTL